MGDWVCVWHRLLLVVLVVVPHVLVVVVGICATVLIRIAIHSSCLVVVIVFFWVLKVDTDLGGRGRGCLLLLGSWLGKGIWWLNRRCVLHWLDHTSHLQVRVVHLLLVVDWLHWHYRLHIKILHFSGQLGIWSQC